MLSKNSRISDLKAENSPKLGMYLEFVINFVYFLKVVKYKVLK